MNNCLKFATQSADRRASDAQVLSISSSIVRPGAKGQRAKGPRGRDARGPEGKGSQNQGTDQDDKGQWLGAMMDQGTKGQESWS